MKSRTKSIEQKDSMQYAGLKTQTLELMEEEFSKKMENIHKIKKAETYLHDLQSRRIDLVNIVTIDGNKIQGLKIIGYDAATFQTGSKELIDKVVKTLINDCNNRIKQVKAYLITNKN